MATGEHNKRCTIWVAVGINVYEGRNIDKITMNEYVIGVEHCEWRSRHRDKRITRVLYMV